MELRSRCQEERRHFVDICRDYLTRSFDARVRAAQDRVMALRMREAIQPEVALARQRAENELTDIERTRQRTARRPGPAHPGQARPGAPRRHGTRATRRRRARASAALPEDLDPNIRRRSNSPPKTWSLPTKQAAAGSASGSAT